MMGKVADPLTGGVEDGVGNSGGDARLADLAQADQPERHRRVGLVEPGDIDRGDVGVHRDCVAAVFGSGTAPSDILDTIRDITDRIPWWP